MLILQPDPEAPIYESVRIKTQWLNDGEARRRAKESGYALGRSMARFNEIMTAWAEGIAKGQSDTVSAPEIEKESDDDDHYA